MPLADFSLYENKVSGSFNLAFAYKKPLICEEKFSVFEDFRENGIFYHRQNMIDVINSSASQNENHHRFYRNEKWTFEYQSNRYLRFLFE